MDPEMPPASRRRCRHRARSSFSHEQQESEQRVEHQDVARPYHTEVDHAHRHEHTQPTPVARREVVPFCSARSIWTAKPIPKSSEKSE
jgi:hypothetical protein